MTSHKRKEYVLRAPCAQLHPDDGVNPRDDKRRDAEFMQTTDRKTRQLCKQVGQAVQLALVTLPGADEMLGVFVREVVPAPNAGRLRVVIATQNARLQPVLTEMVQYHAARLRGEVAAAISRRRTPELTFDVIVEGGGRD